MIGSAKVISIVAIAALCLGAPEVKGETDGARTVVRSEVVIETTVAPGSEAYELLQAQQEPLLRQYFNAVRPTLWRSGSKTSAAQLAKGIFETNAPIVVRYRTAAPLALNNGSRSKTHPDVPDPPPGYDLPSNPNLGDTSSYMTCGFTPMGNSQTEWELRYVYTRDSDGDGDADADPEWVVISFTSHYVDQCEPM